MKLVNLRYLILPILYLSIGGAVTAMLVQRVLDYATTVWLLLLLPMVAVTVLLTVVGIVNVWLSYRTWHEHALLRQYDSRSMLWLCLRGWAVVMAGLTLGVLFVWMHDMLPSFLQDLFVRFEWLFYLMDAFLTLMALMSIVKGENLEEIRLRNAQSENQLLKSQLNPHLLYNTLNTIDALIWLDQERASEAVTSLSTLMRYMTYSARQELVPLDEEVRAITQLCDLQRLRMATPDALQFETKHEASAEKTSDTDRLIAPLLLIPLVENCFKHCGAINEPNAISIRLEVYDRKISLMTDNNLPAEEPNQKESRSHGVGLTVLRRRLELLYPGSYTFTAQREGSRFRTKLTVAC